MLNRSMLNHKVFSALTSDKFNVWGIALDNGKIFDVAPAHLLLRKSDTSDSGLAWTRFATSMPEELRAKPWRISAQAAFGQKFKLSADLMFCEANHRPEQTYLRLNTAPVTAPCDASLYYHSYTIDDNGRESSSFGAKDVLVWRCAHQPELLEGDDVGFQGLSGAACVSRADPYDLLGIYLRREDPVIPRWTERKSVIPAPAPVPRDTVAPLGQDAQYLLAEIRANHKITLETLNEGFASTIKKEDLREMVNSSHRRVARLLSAEQVQKLVLSESVKVTVE